MIRKHLSITPAQARALNERARRERVSEAALLRRAVDRLLGVEPPTEALNRQTDDLVQFVRMVGAAHPSAPRAPGEGRGWTRDELYDERLSRWLP